MQTLFTKRMDFSYNLTIRSNVKKRIKDGPNLCGLLGISELQWSLLLHLRQFCAFLSQKNMAITESNALLKSQIMTLLKIQMHYFFSSHVMLYVKFCITVVSLRYYNGVIRITIIMQMHMKDRIPDIVPQIIG